MKLCELITEKVLRVVNHLGETDIVLQNPTQQELINWLMNRVHKKDRFDLSSPEKIHLRGITNRGDLYIWNAYWGSHSAGFKNLNLEDWDNSYFFYVVFDNISSKFSDVAYNRYTGKEPREIRKQVQKLFRTNLF